MDNGQWVDKKRWGPLLATVGDLYGNPSYERTLFVNKGYQAGVDH
jgi:hypothetical protein